MERQETAAGTKRLEVGKSVKSLKQRLTQVEEKQSSAEPVVIPGKKNTVLDSIRRRRWKQNYQYYNAALEYTSPPIRRMRRLFGTTL